MSSSINEAFIQAFRQLVRAKSADEWVEPYVKALLSRDIFKSLPKLRGEFAYQLFLVLMEEGAATGYLNTRKALWPAIIDTWACLIYPVERVEEERYARHIFGATTSKPEEEFVANCFRERTKIFGLLDVSKVARALVCATSPGAAPGDLARTAGRTLSHIASVWMLHLMGHVLSEDLTELPRTAHLVGPAVGEMVAGAVEVATVAQELRRDLWSTEPPELSISAMPTRLTVWYTWYIGETNEVEDTARIAEFVSTRTEEVQKWRLKHASQPRFCVRIECATKEGGLGRVYLIDP